MSEAVNDSSRLLAQALENLKNLQCQHCTQYAGVEDIVLLLEQALDKLLTEK